MPGKKTKILYVLHWFPVLSETFILNEILELQKLDVQIDIARLNQSPDKIQHPGVSEFKGQIFEPKPSCKERIKSHLYWLTRKPGIYFGTLFLILSKISHPKTVSVSIRTFCKTINLAYQLKDSGYDHIHAHFGTSPATSAWILSRFLNIPYSFTCHAVDVFLPDKLLVRKVSESKFTSVISNFNIDYLKTRFPEIDSSKFRIVRCGIRPDEFEFKTAPASRKPSRILSIGRMVETKGFQYLIESVKILKERGRTVNLTIVGGGDNLDHYKQLSEKYNLGELIKFTGPQPSNEVQKLMADSDLFVLASCVNDLGDRDGIPVVLMEALAMGIPTISTEVSGIPELVIPFETGLLVPEKDPKALADAMSLYLQERDLRERLPKSGRKLVESEFNVVTNAGRLLGLIRLNQ